MDTQKQQIVDSLKQANNILVTVSNNPSVDQLAACIGLTLALNKMKKHATAVFSGAVPPIIEFLHPEKTIERTTDSLRDFIIAIDKAKADKLRYKVEDKFVKIFITPYRTSISQSDLEFSEGDFNVDVVLALGVHKQTDLDQAITAHGRILHDATVVSINNQPNIELGSINLLDPQASSLSEIAVELLDMLDKSMVDDQIATALLTGIVAETDRFRNAKTTPTTMSISAELLTAGANQQLVASKLEVSRPSTPIAQMSPAANNAPQVVPANKPDDGTLQINHEENGGNPSLSPVPPPGGVQPGATKQPQINIDENGRVYPLEGAKTPVSEPKISPIQQPSPLPSFPPAPGVSNSLPPLPPAPPDPFASSSPMGPANDFGLPPLPPLPGGVGQPGSMPAPAASYGDPLSSQQAANSLPSFPPAPQPTPQPVAPLVSPSIIQPDPNAAQAQQPEEPVLPPVMSNVPPTIHTEGPHLMMQPPTFGSELTAGTMPQDEDEEGPSGAAISLPQVGGPGPLLEREPLQPLAMPPLTPLGSAPAPSVSLPPPPPPKVEPSPATPPPGGAPTEPPLLAEESLTSLERDVKSPHLDYIESPMPNLPPPPPPPPPVPSSVPATPPPVARPLNTSTDNNAQAYVDQDQATDVENARNAITAAFQNGDDADEPVASLNAQPLGSPLHEADDQDVPPPGFSSDPNNGSVPPPQVPPPLIPPPPSA